ncbi:hypothetical protein [Campylobacter armoricus]|uniref:hypothetical protein n=1 Tax=Campylobacter armoricus TaxID=2505970 RepID=UPI0011169B04|nr:hypothetical protein [Campylobacter armoricus]
MFRKLIIFFWVISAFSIDYPFFNDDCKISNFDSIQDPFYQNTAKSKSDYSLQAIISNKAKINGKWYVLNDEIAEFKIVEIKDSSVVLIKKDKVVVLNLYDKNNILIY